jgi:isopentenyl phosphate kinase
VSTVYVKLGGSLITDKRRAETPRPDVLARLASEIQAARTARPELRLVLGHGSGSFGHVAAARHGTRQGAATPEQWYGFAEVADAAARLNRTVMAALLAAGIPAWSIQPGVALRCDDGRILAGPEATVAAALAKGLLPVVFGDVALDARRGATIASTEEIFAWLGAALPPARIILAGEVAGVYTGDPAALAGGGLDAVILADLTPGMLGAVRPGLGGSHGVDVTGGMAAKVAQVMRWIAAWPDLEVLICSGLTPGNLYRALATPEQAVGTRCHR